LSFWVWSVKLTVPQLIFIRTDASKEIGAGHVMRCLALAEALRDLGATIEFITCNHYGNLNNQINGKGFKLHTIPRLEKPKLKQKLAGYEQWLGATQEEDANESLKLISARQLDWLIIDHYALDYCWESKLRRHTKRIMVIDDLANRIHDCDLLLDQNYFHKKNRYNQLLMPDIGKLLGPKYTLLRKDFTKNSQRGVRYNRTINRVFIFFGGSDLDNLTSTVLKVLIGHNLKHLSLDVVIGSSNPHQKDVHELVMECPNAELHIQTDNISELMIRADIALGAGGTTTWERMSVGLPSIVLTTAENQVPFIRDLDRDGYIKWLGSSNEVNKEEIHAALLEAIQNPSRLRKQSKMCQKLVDGMGAQRVSKLLIKGHDDSTLIARRARIEDCRLYWYWANDIVVRKNAFNQQFITWEDHQAWFDEQLNNRNTFLLLIESEFGPIGQVRFEYSGTHFIIDYSISRKNRGLGLGMAMLIKAIDYISHKQPPLTLIARVKDSNLPSKKIFKKIGFNEIYPSTEQGSHWFQLKLPLTE